MPAGAVCACGDLTNRPSRKCERCELEKDANALLRRSVYGDRRWTECRLLVWARDGWRCVTCGYVDVGNLNRRLDAHHKIGVLELLARGLDPFDPDLAETRCKSCHGALRH